MSHPFEALPGSAQFLIGLVAAALLVAGSKAMAAPGRTMKRLGCSVICFELAGTPAKLQPILARWGSPGRDAARRSLMADTFCYVPGYAFLTSVIAAASAHEVGVRSWGALGDVSRVIAWAALVAGALDLVENASLAAVLRGRTGAGRVARSAALVKFLLIAAAVAWVLLVALPIVAAPGL